MSKSLKKFKFELTENQVGGIITALKCAELLLTQAKSKDAAFLLRRNKKTLNAFCRQLFRRKA